MRKKRKHWLKRRRRGLHNTRISQLAVWFLLVCGLTGVGMAAGLGEYQQRYYGLRNQTQLTCNALQQNIKSDR